MAGSGRSATVASNGVLLDRRRSQFDPPGRSSLSEAAVQGTAYSVAKVQRAADVSTAPALPAAAPLAATLSSPSIPKCADQRVAAKNRRL